MNNSFLLSDYKFSQKQFLLSLLVKKEDIYKFVGSNKIYNHGKIRNPQLPCISQITHDKKVKVLIEVKLLS